MRNTYASKTTSEEASAAKKRVLQYCSNGESIWTLLAKGEARRSEKKKEQSMPASIVLCPTVIRKDDMLEKGEGIAW